ncbi:MAG: hypothetical protein EOP87_08480 [Verrucomicrobiaceae bacterium]|nr:MAG: hypothetical protein EOP87_08480 [Verrucomicrobiaceae bacterium]
MNLPTGYTYHPSCDYLGVGFSAGSTSTSPTGQGTYYIADGFLTRHTSQGMWQSYWLDVLSPDPDVPPHGGLRTVDIIAPGGTSGVLGSIAAIYGNDLQAAPGGVDSNGQYLGIGADGSGSEYAIWETSFEVAATTTFQFEYTWSPAGATEAGGAENELFGGALIGTLMGANFFVDTDTNYANGGIAFSEASVRRAYNGKGTQEWFTETGTFTLGPGIYFWGFSATTDTSAYITLDGISISPVPEPSASLLAISGAALSLTRRRRTTAA